jgi:hypothetical protein
MIKLINILKEIKTELKEAETYYEYWVETPSGKTHMTNKYEKAMDIIEKNKYKDWVLKGKKSSLDKELKTIISSKD